MLSYLTAKMQDALAQAHTLVLEADHTLLEPPHLLLAMMDGGMGVSALLARGGGDPAHLNTAVREHLAALPVVGDHSGEVRISPETAKLINLAYKAAKKRGDSHVAGDLMLLTLAERHPPIRRLLAAAGVDAARLAAAVQAVRGTDAVRSDADNPAGRMMEQFTANLTDLARRRAAGSGHRTR